MNKLTIPILITILLFPILNCKPLAKAFGYIPSGETKETEFFIFGYLIGLGKGGSSGSEIIMFSNKANANGALGGRTGINTLCRTAKTAAGLSCSLSNTYGFISIDANDEIRDMPGNYGVPINSFIKGPTGITIANSWADILDGTINTSLVSAGVADGISQQYHSGSNNDGSLNVGSNCTGYTVAGAGTSEYGSQSVFDGTWLEGGTVACSLSPPSPSLVCICW